jgi:hypothetical protein
VIISPCKLEDHKFAFDCYQCPDFILYFDEKEFNLNQYYLLSFEDEKIGISMFKYEDAYGINSVEISIYVKREFRLLSTHCIIAALHRCMAPYQNIDKIEFKVYSNNTPCLSLFKELGIMCECSYPNVYKENVGFLDLYSFAIYPEDLDRIRVRFLQRIRK